MRGPAGGRWAEHTVTEAEAGGTVRDVLRGAMGISGRLIQRLTRSRGIQVNRRPGFLARRVRAGDVIAARIVEDEGPGLPPVEMPLSVLWEDAELLVLDKPAGILVHPNSPEHHRTLAHGVAHYLLSRGHGGKVRPVHRIDRDTSGLVIFARNAPAQAALAAELADHTLRRGYLALVHGVVEGDEGVVDAPIGAHPRHPARRAVRPDGDPAVTRFRVVERFADATQLALELETGRTHQIRVHMAHLGHPLIGDRWYGGHPAASLDRPALHAHTLAFRHPRTGERVEVTAPLPPDLRRAIEVLRGGREPRTA